MKEKITWQDVRHFYRYVKPYRWRAILTVLLAIPAGALDAAAVAILRPFTDEVVVKGYMNEQVVNVSFFPILVIVLYVSQAFLKHASNYMNTWVGKKISMSLKSALFDKLLRAEASMFDKTPSGEILQHYSGDADQAGETLLGNVSMLVNRTSSSLGCLAVMFWNSWILCLVAVAALGIGVMPLNRVRRRMKLYIKESVKAGAGVSTNYNEVFGGNRTITSYNLYDLEKSRLQQSMRDIFRLSIKMVQRAGTMSISMHAAIGLGMASILWLQSYLFINKMLTPGAFVAFMVALVALYNPMKSIGNNFGKVQSGMMAIQRVLERLYRKSAIENRPNTRKLDGVTEAIRYENITFSYEPGKPVLRNIDLEIKAGCSVAFVGNSGGGKTTMANLLPRFYDVDSGRITIDGVDIRDLELDNLRGLSAVVFQDNFLFAGTIGENITLGRPDATMEDINRAVKAACLDEFIGSLEHGLDTVIGERGTTLSGGQKQRVAIARAFLKNAPIVILDEATSALDTKSEKVVQRAIENLMLNRTVIIIAHRLSTVINADRIVVIRDGELVESGRHDELIEREGGIYASLYKTQLV